jgi:hypothetical protein
VNLILVVVFIGRAHLLSRFLASRAVRDLLLCAKHLFIAARTGCPGLAVTPVGRDRLGFQPAWQSLESAGDRFLVPSGVVRDLLLCAKHLFIAAMAAIALPRAQG